MITRPFRGLLRGNLEATSVVLTVGGTAPPSLAVLRCWATVSRGQSEHRRPKSTPIGLEKIDPSRSLFQNLFGRSPTVYRKQQAPNKPISEGVR